MPGHSAGIDSRTGIEALKIALDRHQANSDLALVHYPLLREADLLAQQMCADPARQRRWLGLQMLEGDITAGPMPATPPINWISPGEFSDEIDDPALHIADARYQTIAAICDAVSNTLTAEPPLHRRDGQSDPQPLPRVADFSLSCT